MEVSLASTRFALAFAMGVSAYIGYTHLLFWRRGREGAHFWVALWCLVSVIFQTGRYLQLTATTAADASLPAHLQIAMAPMLMASLAAFGTSLARPEGGGRAIPLQIATGSVLMVLALTTDLFLSGNPYQREDWFGHFFWAYPGNTGMALIGLAIPFTLVYIVGCIRRAPGLEDDERSVLLGSITIYALLGTQSIVSSLGLVETPMLAHYAPVAISLGLNYQLVHRHRRLLTELEGMVEGRTEALRDSEERYRRLVDEAPLGVVACDTKGRILAINPHLVSMTGSPSAAASSRINLLDSEQLREAGVTEAFLSCMQDGETIDREFTWKSTWGRSMAIRAHIAATRTAAGAITGVQAIVEDISDRKQLERSLRQARKMEAVGQLAAGIAHEINNPMAYVRTNLTLLRDDWTNLRTRIEKDDVGDITSDQLGELDELVADSLEGVDRTISIVREVMDFSRGSETDRVEVRLNELIEEAVRFAAPQRGAGVRIEKMLGDLPPLHAMAGQLRQLLLNLVINALHAVGEQGTVSLVSRQTRGAVVVRVEDDGCGISADAIDHIFEPFFTTKEAGRGTGLGLYISYEIARAHGGELSVRSEPGIGTAFELRLPLETRSAV